MVCCLEQGYKTSASQSVLNGRRAVEEEQAWCLERGCKDTRPSCNKAERRQPT